MFTMTMIRLDEKYFKKSNKILEDELYSEKKKMENKLNGRGFIKLNGFYLSYSITLKFDNNIYYVNLENVNGANKFKLLDLLGTISRLNNKTLNDVIDLIERYRFDYKLIKYDNINFIYVFNKKYKQMFDDNTYDELG